MTHYRRRRCALCKQLIPGEEVVYRFAAPGSKRGLAPAHENCLDGLRAKVGAENVWLRRRRFTCWLCDEVIERNEEAMLVYADNDTQNKSPHHAHDECAFSEYSTYPLSDKDGA